MEMKLLSAATWRSFAKGRGYNDRALLTALAEFEDVRNEDPEEQIEALDEAAAALAALARSHKTDAALAERAEDMTAVIAAARKLAQAALREAAKPPPLPPQLSGLLQPLLREARRGVPMHALVATTGRHTAVMLSRKPIPPVMRTMLRNHLEASSAKFLAGRCLFENGAHTFVLTPAVSTIERKIKLALLRQTGLRLKVAARPVNADGS